MPQKRSENFYAIQRVHRNMVVNGMCTFNNQYMERGRHLRISPTEEERKKEKSQFWTESGSVCRWPFWKVPLRVLVVFHTQVTIMTVRLDFVHRLKYFRFCNVLHILWTIRAIPTYRVYRLYSRCTHV